MTNEQEAIKIGQFFLSYQNRKMTEAIMREIFHDKIYNFDSEKIAPVIIDAGSNIGIGTIFFKLLYPQAKIWCFESDPNSFALLKKNVLQNCLRDVTLINAALASKPGIIEFYGQIDSKTPYSCGNSIIQSWGEQRSIYDPEYLQQNTIKVTAVQLSNYINEEIDFLKLDIEGAERQVLEELGDKLNLVKEIFMEIHCSQDPKFLNHLSSILAILKKYSFHFDIVQKELANIFPAETMEWVQQFKPKLFELRAYRTVENHKTKIRPEIEIMA